MPPTAGTARFENDMESCSSLVRHSGSGIGTVPMSATAVAMLVENEMSSATINQPTSALVMVSQNCSGSPTCPSSAKTATSVPTAISRLVVFTRSSCCSAGASTPTVSEIIVRSASSVFFISDRALWPCGRDS